MVCIEKRINSMGEEPYAEEIGLFSQENDSIFYTFIYNLTQK
jgi:hypothetical protein